MTTLIHEYTAEEQKKFIDRSERTLSNLRKEIHTLFAFKEIDIKQRNELLNKIDSIKRHLPWCDGCLGANELISATKKLIGNLFAELDKYKKDGEMGKKNKKNKYRRDRDIAEDKKMWFGAGTDAPSYKTESKSMVTVDFKQFTNENEMITVAGGTPKLDRFIDTPIIYILPEVYHKIMLWTNLLDDEITGLGTVEELGKGKFLINSMYLFDQKVSKARCEATGPGALIELCERMEKDGKNPANMKVWWHSHNSMGVTPSGQDDETGRNFCSNGFLISLISNHKGDLYSKMNIFKPLDMIIDNIPVHRIDPKHSEQFIADCKAEIVKYVKNERTTYYSSGPSVYGFSEPVNHVPYHVNPTPLEAARMELEKGRIGDGMDVSPSPKQQTFEDPNHPVNVWGDEFSENSIRYKWNYDLDKYEFFCQLTGKQIMEHEIDLFGGSNYNDFDTRVVDTPNDVYGA